MNRFIPKSICFSAIAALVFTTGCTLSDVDSAPDTPALTLNYTQEYSLTSFTWDEVKVTGFKEYIILQSTEPIPDNPTPEVNANVTILKRIKEVDENYLTTSKLLIGQQNCYKLYCAVDDRFMYSPTICLDQTNLSFEGFNDKGAHITGSDQMLGYDRVNDRFTVVNYKTGEVTNSVHDQTYNFPSLQLYNLNVNTNAIAFNQSPAWLGRYDFPSLSLLQKRSFNGVLWSAYGHHDLIFVAAQEFGENFQVLNKNTLLPIDTRNGTESSQNIAVFGNNPATVLTLGQVNSKRYTVNANGFITSSQDIPGRIGQPDLQHTCAQGSELFIGGNGGNIINRQGENVASLAPANNMFVLMSRFSPDETKAVYLVNRNGQIFLEVADISALPEISVERSIELPPLSYADLIPDEDIIHVIGTTFNTNFPETFVLKYPW